jgi:acetyl esterase
MPLDPQVQKLLGPPARAFRMEDLSVEDMRRSVRESSLAFPKLKVPLGGILDRQIPGPGGALRVRCYRPLGKGPFQGIVYFHGGGWVVGDLDTQDMICRALCHAANARVVSVDYRLAPEHRFPAAVDDAFAATRWVADHARELEIDPARISVAGDSAGGALAAGVALRARDEGGPPLRAQLIFYASCNYPSEKTPSALEFASGPILSSAAVEYLWHLYLADPAREQHHPWASPIRARDHRNLPPAFVASAECDPTRDDCEAYAAKLESEGVATQCKRYAGMPHGFVSWLGLVDAAQTAIDDAAAWLALPAGDRR